MDGFTIPEKNDSQIPSFVLFDAAPETNSTVILELSPYRVVDHPPDPIFLDELAVGARTIAQEIVGELHNWILVYGNSPRSVSSGRITGSRLAFSSS